MARAARTVGSRPRASTQDEHSRAARSIPVGRPTARARPAYATTIEDSVYVRRDRRGGGIGRALLEELVRLASDHGFHTVIARISGTNEPSIRLHRSCGFELVGIEREVGRKHRQWLDVVELQRML